MGHPREKEKVKILLATIWMSYPPRVKALAPFASKVASKDKGFKQ